MNKSKLIFKLILLILFFHELDAQTINTYAGTSQGFSGDGGSATTAQLNFPGAIAVDAFCNVYFSDPGNRRIRKINSAGVISTIAGNGTAGYSGDGGPALAAQFTFPEHLTLDAAGNVYVCDMWNSVVRKISTTGTITTIAGTGTAGFSGDGGPATSAQLFFPRGIAIDASNNIYIADGYNSRIRKINPAGIISTFAGTGTSGLTGDSGPATSAQLGIPTGMTFDALGNLYFADIGKMVVRKINSSNIITTIAGNGSFGYSGDGGLATSAQLYWPMDVAVDATGNVYIADEYNHRIRVVNTSSIINTFAGTGTPGFSGDGNLASLAQMNKPSGIKIDAVGNFYIPDSLNHRIRIIGSNSCMTGISDIKENKFTFNIYPNPNKGTFKVTSSNYYENCEILIYNTLGQKLHEQKITSKETLISSTDFYSGLFYFVVLKNKELISSGKIIVE